MRRSLALSVVVALCCAATAARAEESYGLPEGVTPICGTVATPPELGAAVEEILQLQAQLRAHLPAVVGPVRIPVVVHLISAGRQGRFGNDVVEALMTNLNLGYAQTPFQFDLVEVNRVNRRRWYFACGPLTAGEWQMKRRLSVQPDRVLNIYTCIPEGRDLGPGIIGYAVFPWMFPPGHFLDGVVVHPGSLPSGRGILDLDRLGLVTVHEVGHWLGLFHTFEGGCLGFGDLVGDTAPQLHPTFGCDVGADTCPAETGLDDVTNYMNYADERCWDHFTAGQVERMIDVVSVWRSRLLE